ncbi:hypothetical protein C8J42_103544 [Sphingomonas sp. PP-CE-1A-559]|uniref:hypothetical protein n=1 Tax=Sphingomonas sp. PP-CE-1A-559 TaxID=2135657 RepID=UPI0010553579|nr:hypothetical protein [Sphingomonas sp. PP-CE-1A-559]TCP91852.1 hypothetical protein C8J42_103544 [Sphingomonas sp. PP-CE-1A-559]
MTRNPTTNTEAGAVAGVAAKLTEAQREVILYGECAKSTGPYDCICGADFETLPSDLVCARSRLEGGDGAVVLTPLGLAVRQHLEQGTTAGVPELNEHMFGQGSNQ